jgi:hypothetical protein
MILGQLLRHIDCLKEQIDKLFTFLLHLCVRAFHLADEVSEGKLGVEDAAVLTLFDCDVVKDLHLLQSRFASFEELFFDGKLVSELLLGQILLQLCFENKVKNAFFCLDPWDFNDVLSLVRELVASANRLNHLENVGIQCVV